MKTASKKVHKSAKATRKFAWNKIPEKIKKLKSAIDESSRNVEQVIISPEEREEILNELRQVLQMEHHKISIQLHQKMTCDKKKSNEVINL